MATSLLRSRFASVLLAFVAACGGSTPGADGGSVDLGSTDATHGDAHAADGSVDAPAADMTAIDAPSADMSAVDAPPTDMSVDAPGADGGRMPVDHRPDDSACGAPSPAGTCSFGGGPGACSHDSDCTAGMNGRCNMNMGGAVFCRCTYDTCQHDGDCPTGQTCACHGTALNHDANTCVAGNCRVDADCGAGGFCSPSDGMVGCGGLAGYYCHTASDLCTNDSDCAGGTSGPRACEFVSASSRWECVMLLLCA